MTSSAWSIRLYEAADEVLWAAKLNLLWMIGTVAGGVVLGVGPATVAAYSLARRHASGESFPAWAAFAAVYRREFRFGTVLILPIAAAITLLSINYFYFAGAGASAGGVAGTGAAGARIGVEPGAGTTSLRLVTLGALVLLIAVVAYLLPMTAHYNLRTYAYLPKASLFALTRPASSVLLLFVFTAVAYVSVLYPFLPLVVSVGGWIQLDTWLCLRFFEENEARLRVERIS